MHFKAIAQSRGAFEPGPGAARIRQPNPTQARR